MRKCLYIHHLCFAFVLCLTNFLPVEAVVSCNETQNKSEFQIKNNNIEGCYSNLRYSEESGDLIGVEANIIYSNHGFFMLFQESDGYPNVLHLVKLKVEGEKIEFTIPSRDEDNNIFTGIISDDILEGKFIHSDSGFNLKKKSSYWAFHGDKPSPTGFYSGEVSGEKTKNDYELKLFIVLSGDSYWMLYQEDSGEISAPVLIPVDIQDLQIKFTIPSDGIKNKIFEGTISLAGIVGKFNDSSKPLSLKRKQIW